MQEGHAQEAAKTEPVKRGARNHHHGAGAQQRMNTKKHSHLIPVVILVVLIAHLFVFRQFSYALIELESVKSKMAQQEEEAEQVAAPIVYQPIFQQTAGQMPVFYSDASTIYPSQEEIGSNFSYSINETSS